jgi:hypothetical protein
MPKGHSQLEADVKAFSLALNEAIKRIADLERRLTQANELYFKQGYVPPQI